MIYVITLGTRGIDLEVDAVVETKAAAERHAKELRDMGCTGVRIKAFPSWEAAYEYEDKVRGY